MCALHAGNALTTFNKGNVNMTPKVIAHRSHATRGEMLVNPAAYDEFHHKANINDEVRVHSCCMRPQNPKSIACKMHRTGCTASVIPDGTAVANMHTNMHVAPLKHSCNRHHTCMHAEPLGHTSNSYHSNMHARASRPEMACVIITACETHGQRVAWQHALLTCLYNSSALSIC